MSQLLAHGLEEANAPMDIHDYLVLTGALVIVLALTYIIRTLHKD